jgi:hypothetical protein
MSTREHIDLDTIIVSGFNALLSSIDRSSRRKQSINFILNELNI